MAVPLLSFDKLRIESEGKPENVPNPATSSKEGTYLPCSTEDMYTQLKTFFTKERSIVIGLVLLGVIFLLLGIFSPSGATLGVQTKKTTAVTSTVTPSPTPTAVVKRDTEESTIPTKVPTTVPTQTATSANTSTASNTPTNTPAPQVATRQVNLSINGSGVGSVTVNEGANHCDVLSKAVEQGKISSLNMKFDENYGSYGVYQINGIGKDNAVWWVFKVNGASPNQGCSHIKVNNGETAEWEYKGS